MAWQQTDLDQLDRLLLDDVQEVEFADGRRMRKQPKADMIKLREVIKAELVSAQRATAGPRTTVGRIIRR